MDYFHHFFLLFGEFAHTTVLVMSLRVMDFGLAKFGEIENVVMSFLSGLLLYWRTGPHGIINPTDLKSIFPD